MLEASPPGADLQPARAAFNIYHAIVHWLTLSPVLKIYATGVMTVAIVIDNPWITFDQGEGWARGALAPFISTAGRYRIAP